MHYLRALMDLLSYVEEHHLYRSKCINLIASENIASPLVRKLLSTDLGHRYAIGFLYTRIYRGCKYIDLIEALTSYLLRSLFKAEHVNYIPISGTLANLIMINALTKPGDSIIALSVMDGGHSSFRECSLVHGVSMIPLPFDHKSYNIDIDGAERLIRRVKPRIVLLGASDILFPHPVKELSHISREEDCIVAYDAAHVLGLIAGGRFQDPLREGADIVTGSTHKTFFGPQGGIILCRRDYSETIDHSAWQLVNNHHINRVAALAAATCEMQAFGEAYADQVVRNAKKLAEALYNEGVNVLCSDIGFTESHQVIIDVGKGRAAGVSNRLEEANIIVNPTPLPWDRYEGEASGIRLGVQEVTRLGMKEDCMESIAKLIADIILERKNPSEVRCYTEPLADNYQKIHFCFNTDDEAYRYFYLEYLVKELKIQI
ncbi:MAG: serine hydroxymethyltransferase [Candidatus Bathyarchaeia archaeon]